MRVEGTSLVTVWGTWHEVTALMMSRDLSGRSDRSRWGNDTKRDKTAKGTCCLVWKIIFDRGRDRDVVCVFSIFKAGGSVCGCKCVYTHTHTHTHAHCTYGVLGCTKKSKRCERKPPIIPMLKYTILAHRPSLKGTKPLFKRTKSNHHHQQENMQRGGARPEGCCVDFV